MTRQVRKPRCGAERFVSKFVIPLSKNDKFQPLSATRVLATQLFCGHKLSCPLSLVICTDIQSIDWIRQHTKFEINYKWGTQSIARVA